MKLSLKLIFALLASLTLLLGCGGGGGSHASRGKGGLGIRIVWPDSSSRVIPRNAQSVVVTIKQGANVIKTPRPFLRSEAVSSGPDTVTEDEIGGLDVGTYEVQAVAYAEAAPTDESIPLASGQNSGLLIVADQSTPFAVTMGTTLTRFKIVQTSGGAFTPTTFYLDGAGASSNANGTGRIVPRFNTSSGPSTIEFTPLADNGGTLLLLPANSLDKDAMIKVTGNGSTEPNGLVATYQPTSNTATYLSTITYQGVSQNAGSLTVDYRDFQGGGDVTLKTFAMSVQLNTAGSGTTVTFTGLPSHFDGDLFKIVGSLKEDDELDESNNPITVGTTYTGTNPSGHPEQLAFENVIRHGRGFKLTASLQIATQGGGFVEIAKNETTYTASDDISGATFSGAYYSLTLVTPQTAGSTFPTTGISRDGSTYGYSDGDLPYGLNVRINNSSNATVRPDPFDLTRTSGSAASVTGRYRIAVSSAANTADDTVVFSAALTLSGAGPINTGSFSVKVLKNNEATYATTATLTGLPVRFNGDLYRITGTLKDASQSSPGNPVSPGASYTSSSTANANELAFSAVQNRGRAFTLDASLQIATQGGSYVEIAKFTNRSVTPAFGATTATIAAAFQPGDYYAIIMDTPNDEGTTISSSSGVNRDGSIYGFEASDQPYYLRVKINGSGSVTTVRPDAFEITRSSGAGANLVGANPGTNYRLQIPGNQSQSDETATFNVAIQRPNGGSNSVGLGTFTIKVKKNAGGISVGIG